MTHPFTSLTRSRGSRAALVAMVPALGLAAAGVGTTCLCPDHERATEGTATVADASGHGAHGGFAGAPGSAGASASTHGAADEPTPAAHDMTIAAHAAMPATTSPDPTAPEGSATLHQGSGIQVGTRTRPLLADGAAARAWSGRAGDRGASMQHAAMPTTFAATAAKPAATPTKLSTAQATKKLSKRCQKLVKVKRTKTLSKADRKRRTVCLARRRAIVARSKDTAAVPEATPGVSAPAPAVAGPAPGAATPGSSTPAAAPNPTGTASPTTPSGSTPAPTPTPTPTPGAPKPTGPNPDDVMCSAAGLTATDGQPSLFQMSRAVACPASDGKIYFELVNRDRQVHNLGIQTAGKPSTLRSVITAVEGGERATVAVVLAPGVYDVVCMIAGHEAMNVRLTVMSKSDYIAKGYAG